MEIDGLRLFVLAAEKLNISAAGRELGLAPAVASARLAKLEQTLGTELLHRSTRKVTLSIDGAEFLPFAKEILAQESAALSALGRGSAEPTGTLRFAASSTFAQLYIAPLLPAFLARFPKINLDLRLSDTPFDLLEGSFDLALRSAILEDSSLKARKLADDIRILCAAPSYIREHGEPSSPDELNKHRLIGFQNANPRNLINENGERATFNPSSSDCRLIVDDGLSQKIATINGAGVSLNSMWSVHQEISDGSLIRILPRYKLDDEISLWLVYPKSNILTAKVRVFIDFLIEKIGKRPPWS
ncbi:LysR family transcriptional regulator [Hyphococcus formosus]|uniref:LysR family transcriptional regulator n=1 Tax=Hyphococcus formosus TaxID=3143534 RepID=UPI00398ACC28